MSDCGEIPENLYSFVIGECDLAMASKVRDHLRECGECSAQVAEFRRIFHLTGRLETISPSRDIYREISTGIRPPYFWLKVAGAAAAAALFIVVFLYIVVGPVQVVVPETDVDTKKVAEKDEPDNKGLQLPGEGQDTEPKVVKSPEIEEKPEQESSPRIEPEDNRPVEKPLVVHDEGENGIAKAPENEGLEKEPFEPEKAQAPEDSDKSAVLASIGKMTGSVKVKRQDSKEWLDGAVLLSIMPGDTLETNPAGRVRLDFDNGNYLYINNNAQVKFLKSATEILLRVDKGEIYCEKTNAECELAVDTGFGKVRTREGAYSLKMFGKSKCLLHVVSGEVECCSSGRQCSGKFGELTRAWFQRGKRCEKGTKMRSAEAVRWALKLQPERPEKPGDKEQAQQPKKPDDQGVPPGVKPKKPDQDGKKHGKPGDNGGKVGPGPSPIPPPPGGGSVPGGKHGGHGGCLENSK